MQTIFQIDSHGFSGESCSFHSHIVGRPGRGMLCSHQWVCTGEGWVCLFYLRSASWRRIVSGEFIKHPVVEYLFLVTLRRCCCNAFMNSYHHFHGATYFYCQWLVTLDVQFGDVHNRLVPKSSSKIEKFVDYVLILKWLCIELCPWTMTLDLHPKISCWHCNWESTRPN